MRYANPPGLASFMAKNVGYDRLGAQGVRDSVANDLTAMGSIGNAQSTSLAVAAQDKAADLRREAEMYAADQQRGASTFGTIASAVGNLGSMGIQKFGGMGKTDFSQPVDGVPGARETIGGYDSYETFNPSEIPGFRRPETKYYY